VVKDLIQSGKFQPAIAEKIRLDIAALFKPANMSYFMSRFGMANSEHQWCCLASKTLRIKDHYAGRP